MRLIDADALVESMGLENAVKWGNKDRHQQDQSYSTMMLYEIKDAIDCQPTIGGWISVKDIPPEIPHENPQQGILVVDGNGNVKLTRALLKTEIQGEILIFDDTHSDCFFDLVSGKEPRINTMIKGNHIVYWMPLPEPPKE